MEAGGIFLQPLELKQNTEAQVVPQAYSARAAHFFHLPGCAMVCLMSCLQGGVGFWKTFATTGIQTYSYEK